MPVSQVPTTESGVGVSTDSLGQLDFFIHHNREVRALQAHVERLETELLKYRTKEKLGTGAGSPRAETRLKIKGGCDHCATAELDVATLKERLVELEASAVLSELMGGSSKADFLILQEETRTLRLKNAELEGRCAVQERMIEELKNVKKQLVNAITKIPKSIKSAIPTGDLGVENFTPDEDPVIHHIRVQEGLIAALREQLEILATQLTIGQALMTEHDDEL
jgi:hypothetical protein